MMINLCPVPPRPKIVLRHMTRGVHSTEHKFKAQQLSINEVRRRDQRRDPLVNYGLRAPLRHFPLLRFVVVLSISTGVQNPMVTRTKRGVTKIKLVVSYTYTKTLELSFCDNSAYNGSVVWCSVVFSRAINSLAAAIVEVTANAAKSQRESGQRAAARAAAGSEQGAAGSGQRAAGSEQRAAGSGQRAAGSKQPAASSGPPNDQERRRKYPASAECNGHPEWTATPENHFIDQCGKE
ncbi:hypothetical protein FIBSPDRAFT_896484 [Athelia psychrophila]|uniref:Uncharacterized protein n=1 Tax=Athelia psychrophila TaxID=1759441 RepID=A0A166DE36_9AGAM|nr:hypothetical protein FIBSPDRAFT_896484 [Fibularhizoctonia sp. CBS 109695]